MLSDSVSANTIEEESKPIEFIDQRDIINKKYTSDKNASVQSSQSKISCSCKSIEIIDQRIIEAKNEDIKQLEISSVKSKPKDTTNKSICSVCGLVELSQSDISCSCKSIEINNKRIMGAKKEKDMTHKNVCSVCKNKKKGDNKENSNDSVKLSKSNVCCSSKKGIEIIDQRIIDAAKESIKNVDGVCCKPKMKAAIDKNVCFACPNKDGENERNENVCDSVKLTKSDDSCSCKKTIEFIDQNELENQIQEICKEPKVTLLINKKICHDNTAREKIGNKSGVSLLPKDSKSPTSTIFKENSCLSTCKDNSSIKLCTDDGEYIKTYKEVIKVKRVPDKNGVIHEKKITITTTKSEKRVGPFSSDSKFDFREKRIDKPSKKVKKSKSEGYDHYNKPGILKVSDSVPSELTKKSLSSCSSSSKPSQASDTSQLTSQTASLISIGICQSPTCVSKSDTSCIAKIVTKKTTTTQGSSKSSKQMKDVSTSTHDTGNRTTDKGVDSCCKIKIVSKDDVVRQNNNKNEIEMTPSIVILLKKILSQTSKSASCKSDPSKKSRTDDFSCYKPECSCESITLVRGTKSEPKTLYDKLGEYLNEVNPFKDTDESCKVKIQPSQKRAEATNYNSVKPECNCSSTVKSSPRISFSKSVTKIDDKGCQCSKPKSPVFKIDLKSCKCDKETSRCQGQLKSNPNDKKPRECSCQSSKSCPQSKVPINTESDNKASKPTLTKNSCKCFKHDSEQNATSKVSDENKKGSNSSSCQSQGSTIDGSLIAEQNSCVPKSSNDKLKCTCKSLRTDSKSECSCLKPIFVSPEIKSNSDKPEVETKKSFSDKKVTNVCDCGKRTTCNLQESLKDTTNTCGVRSDSGGCNCSKPTSYDLQESLKSKTDHDVPKCTCRKTSDDQRSCKNKKVEDDSICNVTESQSKCSCAASNHTDQKPSNKTSSCFDSKLPLKDDEYCKCSSDNTLIPCQNSETKSYTSLYSGSADNDSQNDSTCVSLQDIEVQTCVKTETQPPIDLDSRCKCSKSSTERNLKMECKCRESIKDNKCKCDTQKTTSICDKCNKKKLNVLSCNCQRKESLKCSCKSSKQSIDSNVCSICNIKPVGAQTCASKQEPSTCSCKNQASPCPQSESANIRDSYDENEKSNTCCTKSKVSPQRESSKCSCNAAKQSPDVCVCSQSIETSATDKTCASKQLDSESKVNKESSGCSCRKDTKDERKDQCACKSKSLDSDKSKQENEKSNTCSKKSSDYKICSICKKKVAKSCPCKSKKQSIDVNQSSKCVCKPSKAKSPCDPSSKSLTADIACKFRESVSIGIQTWSKLSSDQLRKLLRFSIDDVPMRITPKHSCCFIKTKPQTQDVAPQSVASQCGKVDAATSTRRSDRYDVRTLQLLRETKPLKCPCHSDSAMLKFRRQHNDTAVEKSRSLHADGVNYYIIL